jgi:hypothetical protein
MGLSGRTLGVLGLGKLGSQAAAVGNAFGMKVIAWSQNLTPERAAECGADRVDRDTLLGQSDFVTIHLVLSDRTRGLIGRDELARMKPHAYLVNTSRGPIVDEQALVDALRGGVIAGAGLDVYDVEPLPAAHPLRGLDNVVLTGHTGYSTREAFGMRAGVAGRRAGAPAERVARHGRAAARDVAGRGAAVPGPPGGPRRQPGSARGALRRGRRRWWSAPGGSRAVRHRVQHRRGRA